MTKFLIFSMLCFCSSFSHADDGQATNQVTRKPSSGNPPASVVVTVVKHSICRVAERWFDKNLKTVCYVVSPGGTTSFRMQCLDGETIIANSNQPIKVFDISGSDARVAEKWIDDSQGIACYVSSPGGTDSVDLQCKRFKP